MYYSKQRYKKISEESITTWLGLWFMDIIKYFSKFIYIANLQPEKSKEKAQI